MFFSLDFPAVHIENIAHCLKRIKRDTNRKQDLQVGQGTNDIKTVKQQIDVITEKISIFKTEENAAIDKDVYK